MPTTCIITGYKLGASTIIIYGFILSGTVFDPPDKPPNINSTFVTTSVTSTPTTYTELPASCGQVSATGRSGARTWDTPIARFLMAQLTKRILGGSFTKEGDWPWMAYLYQKARGKYNGFFCGGTLINNRWIVSAAHCISQPNSPEIYGVILGEHNASRLSLNEKAFDVEKIIRHEDFFGSSFNNDIALLKLAEFVTFTRYIQPACLAPPVFPIDATENQEFNGTSFTYAGRLCTVLGWGQTEKGNKSDTMQKLHVKILPHLLCTSVTSNPSEPYHGRSVNEHDPKFCAGGTLRQDTCAGDSGGPLLCIYDNRYYLHGLTSYGTDPCAQSNKPGIYTRITDFNEWIMANIS